MRALRPETKGRIEEVKNLAPLRLNLPFKTHILVPLLLF
jgi:hypothetical protein